MFSTKSFIFNSNDFDMLLFAKPKLFENFTVSGLMFYCVSVARGVIKI